MKIYTRKDLEKGYQVYFKRNGVPNHDLYWTVIDFNNDMVLVKILEMGYDDEINIDYNDITKVIEIKN